LYTFVDIRRFTPLQIPQHQPGETLKLVTVGALRYQKNHIFLVEVMKRLKDHPVQIDIYGDGPLRNELEKAIAESGVNIRLMGQFANIEKQLGKYHAFIMPSHYEGFSLSVLEAMALQIPLLLSDIPSFREQCENTALYFPIDNPQVLESMIKGLLEKSTELAHLAVAARERVVQNFTLPQHIEQLRKIYQTELATGNL
jgi:glycosyltransferase involved in cell wall biosynthesis